MNERIEKLARQADACYIPRYDLWQMDSETLEKFTELIVRECADVGSKFSQAHPEDIQYQIKKYFGVEE